MAKPQTKVTTFGGFFFLGGERIAPTQLFSCPFASSELSEVFGGGDSTTVVCPFSGPELSLSLSLSLSREENARLALTLPTRVNMMKKGLCTSEIDILVQLKTSGVGPFFSYLFFLV